MLRTEKPWGFEELIEQNDTYVVKRITMNPGHRCSLQYHDLKRETIMCLAGVLCIKMGKRRHRLIPFQTLTIPTRVPHRMMVEAHRDVCVYLECSTNHLDDIVRLEDDYGRPPTETG